jgi:crotonobetainyl-CoA:carnitine CoA-transferase CaiB-like acyl-CoA transferase
VRFPSPAPRFSVTPARAGALPESPGADGADILRALGFADDEIGRLVKSGSMKSAGGG